MFNRSVFISIAIFCGTTSASIAADSKYCTTENFARVSKLYENRTHETAKTIFSVLNCGGGLSKKTKRAQFTALVGGLMHVSPELIDDIYSSAQEAGNLEAPKIFLDAFGSAPRMPVNQSLKPGHLASQKRTSPRYSKNHPLIHIHTLLPVRLILIFFGGTSEELETPKLCSESSILCDRIGNITRRQSR